MTARRGTCGACGSRARLRADGRLGLHYYTLRAHAGHVVGRPPCPGTGNPPRPLTWDPDGRPECGECLWFLYGPDSDAHLLAEAISSVAIETGGDPARMLRDLMHRYHDGDHQELMPGGD